MPEDVYTHGRLLRLPEGKTVIGDGRGIAIASDPPYGTIIVQEGGTDVDTATGKINFDASDFSTASSPAGTVSVGLAYGTSAGTPAEGNHTHSSTYAPIDAKYIVQQERCATLRARSQQRRIAIELELFARPFLN